MGSEGRCGRGFPRVGHPVWRAVIASMSLTQYGVGYSSAGALQADCAFWPRLGGRPGGAFVAGSSLAARAHSALARSNGAELVSVDYRLAPEHPFPAALDDVWAVYSEVARDRPTVIIGESAGGGLAMSLVRRVLDRGGNAPNGLVTMFPWADLTNSSDSFGT